jgi:hypothetical protein
MSGLYHVPIGKYLGAKVPVKTEMLYLAGLNRLQYG